MGDCDSWKPPTPWTNLRRKGGAVVLEACESGPFEMVSAADSKRPVGLEAGQGGAEGGCSGRVGKEQLLEPVSQHSQSLLLRGTTGCPT